MKISYVLLLFSLVASMHAMRGEVRNRQISRSRFVLDSSLPSTRSFFFRTTPPPFTVLPGFWAYLSDKPPPTDPHKFVSPSIPLPSPLPSSPSFILP
ncbi:hypothetical protein PRIPAC_73095 [Pristionchus pacificus]|uniref:Uncharacterized protein n=1 Tax=Pristionchus pacificus TaxID=54126 RepID=A0A2A6CZG4_PRIPA|nr:hypothetical protein PRIPAC_73095 [Pristionchus pacificus]|eukprot:PDM83612.1 hypothetical protein PRIPAC_30099 [Pristionchus pacificus]